MLKVRQDYKINQASRRERRLGATTGLHVEEVIVKTFVSGGVSLFAVSSVMKETQRRQRSLYGFGAAEVFALDRNRIGSKSKTDCGNRSERTATRAVAHESVLEVYFICKVFEGVAFETGQILTVSDGSCIFCKSCNPVSYITRRNARRLISAVIPYTRCEASE